MKIIEMELHIGAEKPFDIIHASDTHIAHADGRDNDGGRKIELAQSRSMSFPDADANLKELSDASKRLGAPIMYTGDMNDFVSVENLEISREFSRENDIFMAAGNHEFSLYVGEAKEDAAYRAQSLDAVQASFNNDIRFSSRVINGVNFVALDNSYYLVEEWQLKALKAEAEKGMPVVLMMHVPVHTDGLYHEFLEGHPGSPAYLMAVPEEMMGYYSAHRFEQQRADDVTREAYEYIMSETRIKALLTGHLHMDYLTMLPGERPQIVTGMDTMKIIHID